MRELIAGVALQQQSRRLQWEVITRGITVVIGTITVVKERFFGGGKYKRVRLVVLEEENPIRSPQLQLPLATGGL